jgi:hypothetical protein
VTSKKFPLEGIDLKQPLAKPLASAEPKPPESATREEKHRYALNLSRELAMLMAGSLRSRYPDILPRKDASGHESATWGATGKKRADVKVWDQAKGLLLLVSIKTYSFRDWSAKKKTASRFTKNIKRNRFELQDEAVTIHRRQPFAVMVGVMFMPIAACDDGDPSKSKGPQGISSFAHAVAVLRSQAGREDENDVAEKFERLYIGLYEYEDETRRGEVGFFDVMRPPPRAGRPPSLATLEQVVKEIDDVTTQRHTDVIEWDVSFEELEEQVEDEDDDEADA